MKRFGTCPNDQESTYSHSSTLVKSSQIESDLDRCQNDVNTVMERLHVSPLLLLALKVQAFPRSGIPYPS